MSAPTAAATWETSVQGVVVHTTRSAPATASGPWVTGSRTQADRSTTSW